MSSTPASSSDPGAPLPPPGNPLLDPSFLVPFDRIEASHVEPAITWLLGQAHRAICAIEDAPGPRTYHNTLAALEAATEQLEKSMTVVAHLEAVASTPALREAYNAVQPEVSAFYTSIFLREKLWAALSEVARSDEARALDATRRRFLDKTVADFKRQGAELGAADKERLRQLTRRLTELTSRFAQNVVDVTASFERLVDDPKLLAGLPESAIAAARQSALERALERARERGAEAASTTALDTSGAPAADADASAHAPGAAASTSDAEAPAWRFTLHAPSYIPVLTYLDDASLREELYRAYNSRATEPAHDNAALLGEVLALRQEQARLLGYRDFSDLVLEDRMAKSGAEAERFVRDLTERAKPAFARDQEQLAAFRAHLEGPSAPALEPWDVAYYAEKQRQARFDFESEELRPYFALERVMDGLFRTAEQLYGVSIEAVSVPTWHADVQTFQMQESDGTVLAVFYADLFPRDNKRGGAWMNAFSTGGPRAQGWQPHLALICANVTPPLADRPSLLTHDEVTTLFHEFGHLLHHCLSRVEVRSLGGTNVAWDFVELPSQIMENWCWERQALDTFAKHYQTGAQIGDDLFEKMQRARTYREASAMMRQLGFAATDLALHRDYDPTRDGPVLARARTLMQPYSPAPLPADYGMLASFTHLFGSPVGYAAGYYSYKWAEVLDADAFTRFRREGVFNRATGMAFRRAVLERGDSADPATLFESFMGRPPSLDALLDRSGLLEA